MIRSQVNYITITNVTTKQDFAFTQAFDSNRDWNIVGICLGILTAGVMVTLTVQGQDLIQLDATFFGQSAPMRAVQAFCPAKIQPHIGITNLNAGVISNIPVTIFYEPQGPGP